MIIKHVFKPKGRGKEGEFEVENLKAGDLIRSTSTPNYINIVVKKTTHSKGYVVHSARYARVLNGQVEYLRGERCRSFLWGFRWSRWQIVEHYELVPVDETLRVAEHLTCFKEE